MEKRLKNICEQTQEKYQRNFELMEEYKQKLEQEMQWYILTPTSTFGTEAAQMEKCENEKITSQKKALETAKQMFHQTRGESNSPEMHWDYYGVHAGEREQLRQEGKVVGQRIGK